MKQNQRLTNHEALESREGCCLPASFPAGAVETERRLPTTTFDVASAPGLVGQPARVAEQFAPTPAQPIRQHARYAGDPVHAVSGGGYQWGGHGKVYHGSDAKAKATAQGRAAYANGYKGSAGR